MTTNEEKLLSFYYNKLHWSLFPVRISPTKGKPGHHDKKPLVKWKPCQTKRADPVQLAIWKSKFLNNGWGLATGALSGVVVVDPDTAEARRMLEERGMPRTPIAKTLRDGGSHFYFKHPGFDIRNHEDLFLDVDFRGDGGYAVVPPSFCGDGAYEWEVSPEECDFADMPAWLLKAILEAPKPGIVQVQEVEPEQVQEAKPVLTGSYIAVGGRHAALFAIALTLASLGRNEEEVLRQLRYEYENHCDHDPPKPDEELVRMAHDVTNVKDCLLNEKLDDLANAKCVINLLEANPVQKFLYTRGLGWLVYNGRYWDTELAEPQLERVIEEVLRRRVVISAQYNDADKHKAVASKCSCDRAHIEGTKSRMKAHLAVATEFFTGEERTEQHRPLLNMNNGVLNLLTGELLPHAPDYYFTYCLKLDYNPRADYAEWEAFIESVGSHGRETLDYLQIALGYSITGLVREKVLFWIQGEPDSGKGVIMETIQHVLGDALCGTTSVRNFTTASKSKTQNFHLAPLKSARFVVCSETRITDWLDESALNLATGGDKQEAEFKGKTPFGFFPVWKLWFLSNNDPRAAGEDDAIWGRIKLIRFPVSHHGRENKTLKERFRRPEFLEGVLLWLQKGAEKYAAAPSGLEEPPSVALAVKEARFKSGPIDQWAELHLKQTLGGGVSTTAAYFSFKFWCEDVGVTVVGQERFTQRLRKMGYETGQGTKIKDTDGKWKVGIKNVRLVPRDEAGTEDPRAMAVLSGAVAPEGKEK